MSALGWHETGIGIFEPVRNEAPAAGDMEAMYDYGAPQSARERLDARPAAAPKQEELRYSPLSNVWVDENGYAVTTSVPAEAEQTVIFPEQRVAETPAPLPESLLQTVRQLMAEGKNAYGTDGELYSEAGWFMAPKGWFKLMDYQKQYETQPGCVRDMLFAPIKDEHDVLERVELMEIIESGEEWDQALVTELDTPTVPLAITEEGLAAQEAAEFARRKAIQAAKPVARPKISVRLPELSDDLSLPDTSQFLSQASTKPTDFDLSPVVKQIVVNPSEEKVEIMPEPAKLEQAFENLGLNRGSILGKLGMGGLKGKIEKVSDTLPSQITAATEILAAKTDEERKAVARKLQKSSDKTAQIVGLTYIMSPANFEQFVKELDLPTKGDD